MEVITSNGFKRVNTAERMAVGAHQALRTDHFALSVVQQHQAAIGLQQHVAGMRVGMQHAMVQDHAAERFQKAQQGALRTLPERCVPSRNRRYDLSEG